jgi:hypothetical protein
MEDGMNKRKFNTPEGEKQVFFKTGEFTEEEENEILDGFSKDSFKDLERKKEIMKTVCKKPMSKESQFTNGVNPLCQNDGDWMASDEQSSEMEVNDFLYALIRMIKPKTVVETGSYLGEGTIAIARGLEANGFGRLFSCDVIGDRVEFVNKQLAERNLFLETAQVIQCKGIDLIKQIGSTIDFAFIDSSPEGKVRGEEISALIPYLRPLKMFALHDTAPQHAQIRAMSQKVDLPSVYFNTPRGLTLYMKK